VDEGPSRYRALLGGRARQPDGDSKRSVLVNQGASQQQYPGTVNAMGNLMGGRLRYAGVYLPDGRWFSECGSARARPWEHAGYRLILSVPSSRTLRRSSLIPARLSLETGCISWPTHPDAVAALRKGA
jgi:hypothetical protein